VIATDTPSGLASRAGGEQYIRFRAPASVEEELAALPAVRSLRREGDEYALSGREEALQAVMGVLIRHGVTARNLRIDQASLDDAFVALTQRART
jgi:ABC-2 type transport system ATP-binding protein